jgi:hypothetical protein
VSRHFSDPFIIRQCLIDDGSDDADDGSDDADDDSGDDDGMLLVIFSARESIDECCQVEMTRTMVVTTTSSVGPPGSPSSSRLLRQNLSRTPGCLLQDISYMSTLYLLLYHLDVVCIECIMYPAHSFEFQLHCIQCMDASGLPVVQA